MCSVNKTMESAEKNSATRNDVQAHKVDLDKILVEELGQFGWYQLRILLLGVVIVQFIGIASNEFIFTTARIKTRCLIPGCEQNGSEEFSPTWILNAIPASGKSFDNCARFPVINDSLKSGQCSPELFDRNMTVKCEKFVYENTNTIVYEFGLACDEWRRTFIGSLRIFGTLLVLPVSGYISDRWGRRTILTILTFNAAWMGILRCFAFNYVGFLISTFVESALGSGGFPSIYILVLEIFGPKYRVIGGAVLHSSFALSQILLGLVAWAVPNWRSLTLALYVPQLASIAYLWIMPESVRWLMSKGKYERSEKILKEIAAVNRNCLSDKSLQELRDCAEEENKMRDLEKLQKSSEPSLIVKVFRNKAILLRCAVSPIWWTTMTFIYYGLSINSVNLTGNQYLNYIAVSAIEIPGFWTAVFLMTKVGRKSVLITCYWICAACQIAYIFLPNDHYALSLTVYLIGKYSISTVVPSLYIYTAELFPTKHRHSLLAFGSMVGRVGAIVAPLTPAFGAVVWDELPFALFAGFALLSGFLVFLTPETKDTKLPDTMEEATRIGDKMI